MVSSSPVTLACLGLLRADVKVIALTLTEAKLSGRLFAHVFFFFSSVAV